MDSIIPLGQKNILAEYMILSGADNHPPMLDKDLEWGDLNKKYVELSVAEKIQADCDMKATNIILQGLPADIYSLVNHHKVAKDLWERIQLLMQGDDPIACLNKAMAFLTAVASSRFHSTNNQLRTSDNLRNQATIQDVLGETMVVDRQGLLNATTVKEAGQILDEEQLAFLVDPRVPDGQAIQIIIPNNVVVQTKDLDTYDFDCDDISNAKAVLMTNISIYGSDVISEVPHSETYLNDMENHGVHAK
ncbi:hypothetical protein Tco_0965020 [Tanacetum coccineum]